MVGAQTRPLVVCDPAGNPVDVVLQNEKGFRKSLENGMLWSLHPETDRLLPYAGESGAQAAATVQDCGTWYRATLAATGESGSDTSPGGTSASDDDATPSDDDATPGEPRVGGDAIGSVLGSLVGVIANRHREMPEGSYTTHLFTAGNAKIRKKTGEEAVELILASDRAELTSEAADLIYHLLVLLEVEGVSLDEIAAELKKR